MIDPYPHRDHQPSQPYSERTARTVPVRMRVLPVPDDAGGFLIVFDRVPLSQVAAYARLAEDMKAKTGAVGVLTVPDEIDAPQAFDPREVS